MVGLTDSQAAADDLMRRMTAFAIKTPFDLPGVQNVTTRLLAARQELRRDRQECVLDYVQILGDTAAINGKGADSMLNVATTMGKISGQGRVMTRDMNAITANFPSVHPWEILSEMTGKTQAELRKLAAKPSGLSGIVDASEFINTLNMKHGPRLLGYVAGRRWRRRMATLEGTMELFKDTMGVALANGLQPFFTSLQGMMTDTGVMSGLTNLITGFSGLSSAIIEGVAPRSPACSPGSTTGIVVPASSRQHRSSARSSGIVRLVPVGARPGCSSAIVAGLLSRSCRPSSTCSAGFCSSLVRWSSTSSTA